MSVTPRPAAVPPYVSAAHGCPRCTSALPSDEMVLRIAEQEQERLGRELHDNLGQELAGAAFLAKALAARLEGTDPRLAADADWIKQLLGRCLEGVRSLSRQLSPTELEQGDLVAALERLCADVERAYGIHCRLQVDAGTRGAFADVAVAPARHVFRVCQEALNNATRHGAGRRIDVRVDTRRDAFRLAVIDDGIGPQPDATPTRAGMGLHSMRLRARALGGRFVLRRMRAHTLALLQAPLPSLSPTTPGVAADAHPRR